eukprot:7809170-Heterocapsa_arctica.AAC.1
MDVERGYSQAGRCHNLSCPAMKLSVICTQKLINRPQSLAPTQMLHTARCALDYTTLHYTTLCYTTRYYTIP